ncbi:MAG TPA: cytochrome o ubiquinol oxidase subunit IV [Xanthobacteraceae bacterium]|nr:cytochrome o ubiquinol oxidase subunit IV [Xanthobacteraceae bacterium]
MTDERHMDEEGNVGDVGPGFMNATPESIRESVQGYLIGFVLAALLTVASFYVLRTGLIWAPGIVVMLAVLAVAQIGVHLVFFMHLTTAPDNTNNVLALVFGIIVVVLIIGGSIWIMGHLNERVMPMYPSM